MENVVQPREQNVVSTTFTENDEQESSRPVFSQRARQRTDTIDFQPLKQDMAETLPSVTYQRQKDGETLNLCESNVYEKEKPRRVEELPLQNVEMVQHYGKV